MFSHEQDHRGSHGRHEREPEESSSSTISHDRYTVVAWFNAWRGLHATGSCHAVAQRST